LVHGCGALTVERCVGSEWWEVRFCSGRMRDSPVGLDGTADAASGWVSYLSLRRFTTAAYVRLAADLESRLETVARCGRVDADEPR
jgi:hypothetical protein